MQIRENPAWSQPPPPDCRNIREISYTGNGSIRMRWFNVCAAPFGQQHMGETTTRGRQDWWKQNNMNHRRCGMPILWKLPSLEKTQDGIAVGVDKLLKDCSFFCNTKFDRHLHGPHAPLLTLNPVYVGWASFYPNSNAIATYLSDDVHFYFCYRIRTESLGTRKDARQQMIEIGPIGVVSTSITHWRGHLMAASCH